MLLLSVMLHDKILSIRFKSCFVKCSSALATIFFDNFREVHIFWLKDDVVVFVGVNPKFCQVVRWGISCERSHVGAGAVVACWAALRGRLCIL